MCPSPWAVLGLRHRGLPSSANAAVIGSSWHTIELPGTVCGATDPIKLTWTRIGGEAYVHSALWPWWPVVEVNASGPNRIGDVDGDGESDAYYRVACSNTGGTGESVLATADVLFAAKEDVDGNLVKPLRLLGIIQPQQPNSLASHPPYPGPLDVVSRNPAIVRSQVIVVPELWYGPLDPSSCCPSGRATTIWKYASGRLEPVKTIVDLAPTAG